MKPSLTIFKRSHHFLLKNHDMHMNRHILEFSKTLIQWRTDRINGRFVRTPKKVYACATDDRSEYRFHINHYGRFVRFLFSKGISIEDCEVIEETPVPGADAPISLLPNWKPRGEQGPAIEYLKQDSGIRAKMLEAQMGVGKSYMTMQATSDRAKRTMYVMKAGYMKKWLKDFKKTYGDKETMKKCVFVSGSADLKRLIELAVNDELTYSNIVVSNRTFMLWIKAHKQFGENIQQDGWLATPDKFTELFKVDSLVFDEFHQDFHFNVVVMLYTHVCQTIALTGTLVTHDKELMRIYAEIQPLAERYSKMTIKKYIAACAYLYGFSNPEKIAYQEPGRKDYSHHAFERSIMRDKKLLEDYFGMVEYLLKFDFFKIRRPEQTCLVFFASIKMCQLFAKWLSHRYPAEKISYFVQGGDYDKDFIESTIVISTIGKSGTAVDKANLLTCVLTNALDSKSATLQALGRLRELDNGDTPLFFYFVNTDNRKHVEYHERKQEYIHEYIKTYRTRLHDTYLG